MITPCPSCGEPATGRFCSSCGTALAGATCGTCSVALTPGAHFCHRCGTPAGSTSASSRGIAGGLPWAVAAIALVALIALVVGQRFGSRGTSAPESAAENAVPQSAPFAGADGAMPRAPDISQLTPSQKAERLYDRIMRESEAGNTEGVRTFMPMAIAAYEMIAPLNLDQRYDLGRLGEVAGDSALARAEADTILATRPTHLLGLVLAAKAARMENKDARARQFDARLLAAEPTERNAGLAEYLLHANDIHTALDAARAPGK
jgi:hypothetical protein